MFGEPGLDFFESWANFILLVALLIIGLWVYSMVVKSKAAESISKSFKPFYRWYSGLSFGLRKFLRVFSFMVYCAACLALIVYISS